jgi:hypothetical protein
VSVRDIQQLIPFLASKFTPEHFKTLQINLFISPFSYFDVEIFHLAKRKADCAQPKIIRITAENPPIHTINEI